MLNFSKEMIVDISYDQLLHHIQHNHRTRQVYRVIFYVELRYMWIWFYFYMVTRNIIYYAIIFLTYKSKML